MSDKPLYIFDLDGTLANCRHRLPILSSGTDDRWDRFFAACLDDAPIKPVIQTLRLLLSDKADVWIWTGRSESVRNFTRFWLWTHAGLTVPEDGGDFLKMRPIDDHTPDDQLKFSWLWAMKPKDRARLTAVFEDRDRVVAMWRNNGVKCFQVNYGDF